MCGLVDDSIKAIVYQKGEPEKGPVNSEPEPRQGTSARCLEWALNIHLPRAERDLEMEESRTNAESIATNLPAWDKAAALEVTGEPGPCPQAGSNACAEALSGAFRSASLLPGQRLAASAYHMRGARTSYCGVRAFDIHLKTLESSVSG